eukprot:c25299_g1_i1 orf=112-3003(-)
MITGMAKVQWRWALPSFSSFIVLQALFCWNCGSAQAPGFLSIDCGSTTNFTDTAENGNIEWISDTGLMTEGEAIFLTGGGLVSPYTTMRLFEGNQSKYCYSLSNSAVTEGAFFLVRASFSIGAQLPYTPTSSDGNFRFKLLIDADEWQDIVIADNATNWFFYEIYTRALRSSIDICLARSTPDGDHPFISAIELRPLPSFLYAVGLINRTSRRLVAEHYDYIDTATTQPGIITRYTTGPKGRFWVPIISNQPGLVNKTAAIDTSTAQDMPPANVLQTAIRGGTNDPRGFPIIFHNVVENAEYYCVFYFAEINPAVNATGLRIFNIKLNGQPMALNEKPIDVFAVVGANAAYEFQAPPTLSTTALNFTFSPTSTSVFPPFLAAAEVFYEINSTISTGSFPNDVSAIEDLKASMNLKSYSGDPCLPVGFSYSWLTCALDTASKEGPRIMSISLSNYSMGGEIPKTINTLTMIKQILLDGNNLVGSIPDMSALASLETLDLSNNNLSGSIPESLTRLTNLVVLNLENNNLTGEIPAALLERKQNSALTFEFSGNPLCQNSSAVACTLPTSSSKSKYHIGLIIGVTIPILLLVIVVIIGLTIFCCWKKRTPVTLKGNLHNNCSTQQEISQRQCSNPESVINKPLPVHYLQEFTFEEIKIATNDFNTQLGMGGFGPVYKGTLKDGQIVAFKVASNSLHQGSKEFLNEVDLLSRIHHKNLVRLLGYCNEGKLVLVYEFMSNGSLFDCLHGQFAKDSPLPWRTRLNILVDAAQGFDYLHNGCNPQIIHRDIKSSNILLNHMLEAKISDFGISRNRFVTEAPPTALMGSIGYIDPEYISTMRLTEKVDVYSFGVVLFEVVSGKMASFINASQQQIHIKEWIKPYIDCGMIDDIVDVALHKQYDASSVWKVVEVALACVQYSNAHRPNMSDVYFELKEAQRIEFESDRGDAFDIPLILNDCNSLSLTHVNPR